MPGAATTRPAASRPGPPPVPIEAVGAVPAEVPPPIPAAALGAVPDEGPPPIPAAALGAVPDEGPPPIPAAALLDARTRQADALVEAARAGDPRAFEGLVKRYRHRIYALALHMTGSPSDADDITQDAFVRAFRHIQRFEGRSEFFTWLYRIALNLALNARRDRARRRTADLDDPRVTVAVAVDSGGDPSRALELRQAYADLVSAFDRLSPLLKTTITLTVMQGLSYPEAAVVLDTNEGTIAWRIHEARKQLRAALARTLDAPARAAATPRRSTTKNAPVRAAPEPAGELHSLAMALALLAPGV
jgi:RNA polymerase sigma-70 factor (ECF subfamily)